MPAISDIAILVSASIDPLKKGLNEASSMVTGFASGVTKTLGRALGDPLKLALGTAAGIGLAAGVGGLADGLRDTVTESVKLAASFEKSAVSFEVLLGSADKAKALLADLRQFAAESPLTLKDAIDQGTSLLAAGIAQDQVVPTLRMLSDLAMGDKDKFGRAALAYTQVKSAGNLHGDDMRQLDNLGIPTRAALAKVLGVEESMVRDMVSDNKVQFRDLVKAFKDLTGEGGKFYGMTERGAATLAGRYEQLTDSVEELKREFGRAIIEELDLNKATQDGSKFFDNLKGVINDLRPGIRFTGDVLKGMAQVTGELVRNGPLFASAFGESFKTHAPQMADFLGKAGDFLTSLKTFKLDPDLTINAAVDLASAFGAAFDDMFKSVFGGAKDFWKANIQPLLDDVKSAADAWKRITDPLKQANRIMEVRDASEDRLREMAKGDPLALAAEKRLKDIGNEYKGFGDPDSPGAKAAKERYKNLNLAYSDAVGKAFEKLELEKYNSVVDFGLKDPKTFPNTVPHDITALRAALPPAELAADRAQRELERALAAETRGPVSDFIRSFDAGGLKDRLKGLRDTFEQRNTPDEVKQALLGALTGAAAEFTPPKVRDEVKVPGAPNVEREHPLPNSYEFGSVALADLLARAGVSQEQKMQETQLEVLQRISGTLIEIKGMPGPQSVPLPAR